MRVLRNYISPTGVCEINILPRYDVFLLQPGNTLDMGIVRRLKKLSAIVEARAAYKLCSNFHKDLQSVVWKLSKTQEKLVAEVEKKDIQIDELIKSTTILTVGCDTAAYIIDHGFTDLQQIHDMLTEGAEIGRDTLDKVDNALATKHNYSE